MKNIYVDPEYMKKIIAFTIDFSKLNKSWDSDNIILSQKYFNDAIDYIEKNISITRVLALYCRNYNINDLKKYDDIDEIISIYKKH